MRTLVQMALASFLLVACTKTTTSKNSEAAGEILIGEYGAMTGAESSFGVQTHQGIEMAISEVNAAGGIKGRPVRLVVFDDEGKSDLAVTGVTKLVTQDRVLALLGEVSSTRAIAAGAVAQGYKVPMVSPSSTNPKVTEIGNFIFRVCFIDPFQGEVMAKFAVENLNLKKAAILRDLKSDYSVGLANYFSKNFESRGGQVVADLTYQAGDMDFKSQLTAIRSKKPDFLFLPGYYTEVGLIARQAREMRLSVPLLGGDGWDSDKLTEIGGEAILGGFFSNHYSDENQTLTSKNFVEAFKTKFREVPSGSAAMGYDAAKVTIDAMKRAHELTHEGIRQALTETKDFEGATGKISINAKRDAVKPAVVVRVAKGNRFEFVTSVLP